MDREHTSVMSIRVPRTVLLWDLCVVVLELRAHMRWSTHCWCVLLTPKQYTYMARGGEQVLRTYEWGLLLAHSWAPQLLLIKGPSAPALIKRSG